MWGNLTPLHRKAIEKAIENNIEKKIDIDMGN